MFKYERILAKIIINWKRRSEKIFFL